MTKHRNWMFTSFKDETPNFTSMMWYQVYQREIAPHTGKEHWQGYVEFNYPIGMQTAKKLLGDQTCHLEPRKGTQQQAIAYCMKTESRKEGTNPIIVGIPKNQGSRSDLNSIVEAIESGATKFELLREFKGNALRHLGMIDRAQRAIHGWDEIDNKIERRRETAKELGIEYGRYFSLKIEQTSTEVAGNTVPPLPDDESEE